MCIARHANPVDMARAEHDLIRVQKAITRHRNHCSQCSHDEKRVVLAFHIRVQVNGEAPLFPQGECTGTSVTLWTGDIRYKPLAVVMVRLEGMRRHISSRRGRGNVGIPKGFPKSVGRVGSRLHGFPCFPYSVISMACFARRPR